jgi:hypothetical protein
MRTREITIDKDGRVRNERIDANVALLVEMGRIAAVDAGNVRRAFHDDYEGTLRKVLVTEDVNESAYIGFARAMGALGPGQDPRTLPSVRGW